MSIFTINVSIPRQWSES